MAKTLIEVLQIQYKNIICEANFGEFEEMFVFDEEPTKKEATR